MAFNIEIKQKKQKSKKREIPRVNFEVNEELKKKLDVICSHYGGYHYKEFFTLCIEDVYKDIFS